MGTPRRLARRLLEGLVNRASLASREWAQAMLGELDFIRGDWAALYWALGSAAAICRHIASGWRGWLNRRTAKEDVQMNDAGKKAVGVGMGALSTLMLVGCAFGILRITDLLFPGLGLAHAEWTHWLAVLVVPELMFIVAAVVLWRKKGPVAAGILTIGLLMGIHVAVHMAMR
jgi:hypothetical protein